MVMKLEGVALIEEEGGSWELGEGVGSKVDLRIAIFDPLLGEATCS